MINLYLYCNYQGSAPGFVLKSVNIGELNRHSQNISIETPEQNCFIRKILQGSGTRIKRVYGFHETKWIYVIKNINKDNCKNIALEFDDFLSYKTYFDNFENLSEVELVALLDSFMQQNNQDTVWGFEINIQKLFNFKEKLESKVSSDSNYQVEEDSLIVKSDYELSLNDIKDKLSLEDFSFIQKNKNEIVCKKKQMRKQIQMNKKIIIAFLIGFIISMTLETIIIVNNPNIVNKKITSLEKENKKLIEEKSYLQKQSELMLKIIDENPAIKSEYEKRIKESKGEVKN